jgi:hypothetical protein
MRSTAGIVVGLFLVGIVANCGGNDTGTSGPKGGSASLAGQGGDGTSKGATSSGGTSNGGKTGAGGQGGVPGPSGCSKDADCGSAAKCINSLCKNNDGQTCVAGDDCQHNCIDSVCTSKLPDGKDCMVDGDCAHTCIGGICAPPSDVGGDCDVDLGSGGAGGMSGVGGAGGAEDAAELARAHDCAMPLQCFAGKCLTPDGEACKDNVDCINTCIKSKCQPKQGLNGPCDDKSDCLSNVFVCDTGTSTCKLAIKEQCSDNAQCQSNRCICSDDHCVKRVCKTPLSVCQCRWSPTDSESCDNSSAVLKFGSQDPNGCDVASSKVCDGSGQCVPNTAGDCMQKCQRVGDGPDGKPNTADDVCSTFGAATGCNNGYHSMTAPNGDCTPTYTKRYKADGTFDHADYPCQAVCTCNPNN